MEKHNINIHKFYEKFNKQYKFLYNNDIDTSEMAKEFDEFDKTHTDFVREFTDYREDYISSDREAAAFMLALNEIIESED